MLNLPEEQLLELKEILQTYLPSTATVYTFGSRNNNSARAHSDLDLVIKNHESIPWSMLAEIEEALSESNLPYRVDLLDSNRLTTEFLNEIMSTATLLPIK
jgi:type I restriction enzyme S subunit